MDSDDQNSGNIRERILKAKNAEDIEALRILSNSLIKRGAGQEGVSPDIYVLCAEAALQLGCGEISKPCLKMYFEGSPPANQFLCRAYLCQGQLERPPAPGSVEDIEKATDYFLKAIEVAKHEPGLHFLVFNASVLCEGIMRPLLQMGRSAHFVPSLWQVIQSLEEVNDPDHDWRAQLMMQLLKCCINAEEMEKAVMYAKIAEEFVRSHTPHLFPELFRLLIHHKLSDSDVLLETSQQSPILAAIYKLEELQLFINAHGEEDKEENSSKLQHIFQLLITTVEPTSSSELNPQPLPPAERVAFLLELAMLALQTKRQKVATNCLKELKTAGDASAGQNILLECISCEISLLKEMAKMNVYSKGSVEAQLRVIGRLDQCLLNARRAADPQAMQAVCAAQWRLCLPLLQHNLRKSVRTSLLQVAQALEDIQSLLLEIRCQVHSELASIEEEEGRLEAALNHLHKALQLNPKGAQRKQLSSAAHLLQLRTLEHTSANPEERAAMLIQQAKDMADDHADFHSLLVAVGLLLAPDDFQIILDAENPSKAVGIVGSGPAARLSAKAKHHLCSIQMLHKHLERQKDTHSMERLRVWAELVKTSRKQQEWDVCRATCRFCLLYDDGRWKLSRANSEEMKTLEAQDCASKRHSSLPEAEECKRDLLRLLAEIHNINAEAIIHKLYIEGEQLNVCPVPEQCVSEEDTDWIVYRDWIMSLSAYAISSFLRAAELGAEISEPWVVTNAAVYLWNYNKHLLSQRQYPLLLPTFTPLVDLMRKTQYTGDRVLFAMLCNAVSLGLILPLSGPVPVQTPPPPVEKNSKSKSRKNRQSVPENSSAHKALELCELALGLTSCSVQGEIVPVAVRSQVVSTWVQTKRLLCQQIGSVTNLGKENANPKMLAMTEVLVGLQMFQCNRSPGQMDFSLPAVSTLVSMASDCSWTDAMVELQVWSQLSSCCHDAAEHSLVLSCTERAMNLEHPAIKSLSSTPYIFYSDSAVNEILSGVACLRGQCLAQVAYGDKSKYREALNHLLSSVSYADKAGSKSLCIAAATHYWNTCLALTQSPEERALLWNPLESILNTLLRFASKSTKKNKKTSTNGKEEALSNDLQAAIYHLLHQIHIDKSDLKSAKLLLEKALREMLCGPHKLSFLKSLVRVKARLGENVTMEMQSLAGEGEQCCFSMWHQVALCSANMAKKLACYQKAFDTITSAASQWRKVNLLMELAQWMYFNNFPRTDAVQMVEWAIDLLLLPDPEHTQQPDESIKSDPMLQNSGLSIELIQMVSDIKDVKHLSVLISAHTLLAIMAGRSSPEHQMNLLRASCFVIQLWKVSIAEAHDVCREQAKSKSGTPASAESKKGKDKDKDKGKSKKPKEVSVDEDKPRPFLSDMTAPVSLIEWVSFCCPDQARHTFRHNTTNRCLNVHSIPKQCLSLYYLNILVKELQSLSLCHLTLPALHLAETIAHDLLDRKALAELHRLRIVKTCCELGLGTHSPYHDKLHSLTRMHEEELLRWKRASQILQESKRRTDLGEKEDVGAQKFDICTQNIWLGKAEVCLSMGLHQQARPFLERTLSLATEFSDQINVGRSWLHLAALACEQQNYAQALILLDRAQAIGGDEEFWYQLTQTRVRATVGNGHMHVQVKVDDIVKYGCEALEQVMMKQVNRTEEMTYLITSLKMRGAVECVRVVCDIEPGGVLSPEAALRLKSDCDKLLECRRDFAELHREQAAEALAHCSHGLRVLAKHTSELADKQSFLLDALSQMQAAVCELEHVALHAQSLLTAQNKTHVVSLAILRKLLEQRLALAECCLVLLEEHCAERRRQALAQTKKSSAQIILEDFTRCTPEPHTIQEAWLNVGCTLGQVALSQLAAVSSHYLTSTETSVETRARCLCLTGKYLRLQATMEDPIYIGSLWDLHNQEVWADPKTGVVLEVSKKEDDPKTTPERKLKKQRAQHLLTEASKTLSEACTLCLQHQLPLFLLSEICLNKLQTHGLSDPSVTGQYLALLQSCHCVTLTAKVLTAACSDSKLRLLLCAHTNLLLSHGGQNPGNIPQAAQASLTSLPKAFSHLSINPSHLSLLSELPTNMKLLLLQLSADRRELHGAFFEAKAQGKKMGKNTQIEGLTCSKVAMVPVCPGTLLTLLDRAQTLGQEIRHVRLGKDLNRRMLEDMTEASQECRDVANLTAEQALVLLFRELEQAMEVYLHPLLSQFDYFCLRPVAALEPRQFKDKEDKPGSVTFPEKPREHLVLLADDTLLQLPLEALSVLHKENLSSVSRDFSLQLLHCRLQESKKGDNKKETKGGKGAKAKGDQSKAIKAKPASRSSNTVVNTKNFKYVVDPSNEGVFDGDSLSKRMSEILETHRRISAHLWEGFMGSEYRPSKAEMEQLLSTSNAFIFLGMERFMGNINPAKIAAMDLSGCNLALLFDLVQTTKSAARQSDLDKDKSPEQRALEGPLETALLLSLGGVGGIALNQWHSSFPLNTDYMATVLNGLLNDKLTSGQAIHSLRKWHKLSRPSSQDENTSDAADHEARPDLIPANYNCVLYGVPNLVVS